MKKQNKRRTGPDELRPEYDLANPKHGVRGKYAARFRASTDVVRLSPDVAKFFPDEKSVNSALRRVR